MCVCGGGGGGVELLPPSPLIYVRAISCKGWKLTDYTCYQALVPSVLV